MDLETMFLNKQKRSKITMSKTEIIQQLECLITEIRGGVVYGVLTEKVADSATKHIKLSINQLEQ